MRRWTGALTRPGLFLWRVLLAFRRNQGILLSGAVAYYTLLSIVPLLALLLVGLSHFLDEAALLNAVHTHLDLIVPAESGELTRQIAAFLEERELVGWIGLLVLLFFSTMAFTVLENAMSVIFFHRVAIHRRRFLVSATIPFVYILLLGLGLLLVSLIAGALQTLGKQELHLFGLSWGLGGVSAGLLYLLGVFGLVLLLTSLYLVMPVGSIALRHALIGGATAALLWELTRHLMVWYFSTLSVVNVVYGSLATAVIALLSFEAAALILLFGAQVIAEFERGGLDGPSPGGSAFRT
jgi:YihY family inner membrane protein